MYWNSGWRVPHCAMFGSALSAQMGACVEVVTGVSLCSVTCPLTGPVGVPVHRMDGPAGRAFWLALSALLSSLFRMNNVHVHVCACTVQLFIWNPWTDAFTYMYMYVYGY